MIRTLVMSTAGRALINISAEVAAVVQAARQVGQLDGEQNGLCTVFVRHTSASIVIQENADPRVRVDLEAWMSRLVRDGDPSFTHDEEGPDDMAAHVRSVLTATSVGIPIAGGRLALGQWQGVCLWEHRTERRTREVVVHVSA